MTYFSPTTLQPYLDAKLISESSHPESPHVKIYNYTHLCQFQGAWDDVTLQCRGLILDTKEEKVLARPFRKFFNYQEHIQQGKILPHEMPVGTYKFDGSLGILYWLNDEPWIATRGSFSSDQAVWGTQWFRREIDYRHLPRHFTFLFEIVYKDNQIVVQYNFEALVALACIETDTGREDGSDFQDWSSGFPYVAKRVACDDLSTLAAMDQPNSEGFVILYPLAGLRLKIKFPSYVRFHKIITGLSVKGIWEHLRDGGTLEELIAIAPDEMYAWIRETVATLQSKFFHIEAISKMWTIIAALKFDTRKDQALYIKEKHYPGICFMMMDGKDYSGAIWKMLEPKGAQTFKRESEDA